MKKKLLAALLASALAAGMLPTSACAASADYTTANATLISFTDAAAKASGKYTGYEIDGTDVSITAAGTYVFSGTLHLVFKAGEQESFCAKMRELMAGREEIEVSTPEFAEF